MWISLLFLKLYPCELMVEFLTRQEPSSLGTALPNELKYVSLYSQDVSSWRPTFHVKISLNFILYILVYKSTHDRKKLLFDDLRIFKNLFSSQKVLEFTKNTFSSYH